MNPIFELNGFWYFEGRDGNDVGPYDTEKDAFQEYKKYYESE